MGIQGLHKFLKDQTREWKLKEHQSWTGRRVGVDAMCWMHRGAY